MTPLIIGLIILAWLLVGFSGYIIARRAWFKSFGNYRGCPGYSFAILHAILGPGGLLGGLLFAGSN